MEPAALHPAVDRVGTPPEGAKLTPGHDAVLPPGQLRNGRVGRDLGRLTAHCAVK
jgi:hypothetical protein